MWINSLVTISPKKDFGLGQRYTWLLIRWEKRWWYHPSIPSWSIPRSQYDGSSRNHWNWRTSSYILNKFNLQERREDLLDQEVILLNVDEHPGTNKDYQHAEILKIKLEDTQTRKELKTYIFYSTNEWNSSIFDKSHRNLLTPLTSFIQALVTNQGPNEDETFNKMHILNHNFNKHGHSRDITRDNSVISKFLQI
jgi:hypothetical protein